MRTTGIRILLVSWTVLAAAPAKAAEPASVAQTSDGQMVVGDDVRIRVERHGTREQLAGMLVKLNEHWIVLRCKQVQRTRKGIPYAMDIPLIGGWFAKTHNVSSDEHLWIPREAATIEKRSPSNGKSNWQVPAEESPPTKIACKVDIALHGKLEQRQGGLQDVTDEQLVVSVPKVVSVTATQNALGIGGQKKHDETRYERERLARQDVLCVRVPYVDPSFGTHDHEH